MAATNCSREYLCTICWAITVTAPALVLPHTLSLSLRAEASIVPLLASKRASCLMHMPDIRPQNQARMGSRLRQGRSHSLQLSADQISECHEYWPHLMHGAGDCPGAGVHAAELAVPDA